MKYLRFIVACLFLASVAQAQQTGIPADLRTLIEQANANYPVLKQQQEQIKAGELQADIARTALKPTVTGNATYLYVNPVPKATFPLNGKDVALQFQPNHNVNGNVSLGQTLYDWGRTEANVRRAEDNTQLLRRGLEVTRHNLAFQVAAAYYGIGFIQKSINVQDSVIRTAAANIAVIATRLRNGDALQYDVLTQQVRLKTAQNRKIDLQNQLERQRATLTFLTGLADPTVGPDALQFGGPVQLFDIDGQLQAAQAGNKDILTAQDRLQASETEIRINNLAGKPTLGFSGSAGFKNGYVPDVNTPKFNVAAGIGLSIPIYSGKRVSLQNQALQYSLNANRYAVETANAQLRQSLALVNADIRANQTRLENLNIQVLQAQKALDIAQTRLKNGVITSVELESAETGVEEARLAQLAYQYQLLLNQLEVKRLLGEGL